MTEPLAPGELTIRYYAHACVEVTCGALRIFTDPWLVGPAFVRGWWLQHEPPADWLDRLAAADAIYISHNHTDHLSLHTVRRLAARRRDVPIYVPNEDCRVRLLRATLTDVRVVPAQAWVTLDPHTRCSIIPDATREGDSGLLVEYKGRRLLNNVDCGNLVRAEAIGPVDVLLTSYGGGASGYPVCWGDLYPEARIQEMVETRRAANRWHVARLAIRTQARAVVLFASAFVEAHPDDAEIRSLNRKNTPMEVKQLLETHCPEALVWAPEPGDTFDVATGTISRGVAAPAPRHDFAPYLAELEDDARFEPLATMAGIARYFAWAGFKRPDLVLHVVETDDAFAKVAREFYVDFADLSFPSSRPARPHRYLRMRVRSSVFRHVLRHGLSWEEISIGFQARLYREPDVYNFDFWNHFQNRLPSTPIDWSVA